MNFPSSGLETMSVSQLSFGMDTKIFFWKDSYNIQKLKALWL